MIKIVNVRIQRFRSILDLNYDVDISKNIISICGQNNVGKTNTLRAITLFFKPDLYNHKADIPTLKAATWGGSVHPKIELTFFDDKEELYYNITRDFSKLAPEKSITSGYRFSGNLKHKVNKEDLSQETITQFLNKIHYIFVESINMNVPDLINTITQDMLTIQYDGARFSQKKANLKIAYDTYIDGLQDILNCFGSEISDTFDKFREGWKIQFDVPKNSETFRDLISDDVRLNILDKGSKGVIDKGSGLQRLAYLLLQFEITKKISSKKSVIICIDEPDTYLHEGLQRKLKDFLDEMSKNMQICYTTHSKIFIDTYHLKNTLLLSSNTHPQYITRKNKTIDVMETVRVNIDADTGYKAICDHLGIEETKSELLEKNNLLVEGGCDKKYIEELCHFFEYKPINIIPMNGADNALKYLEYYNSVYKDSQSYKPMIKVILDNDQKGREVFTKIRSKTYKYINVKTYLLPNYNNNSNLSPDKNNTNNEIEDFLYPEVTCFLINHFLSKYKNMNTIDPKIVCKRCNQTSFRDGGILNICEYEKNTVNPERGGEISFTSSKGDTNNIKEGIASCMNAEGNNKLIILLQECDKKYPEVRIELKKIISFD